MNKVYKLLKYGVLLKWWLKYGIYWKKEIIDVSLKVTVGLFGFGYVSLWGFWQFDFLLISSSYCFLSAVWPANRKAFLSSFAFLFFTAILILADENSTVFCFIIFLHHYGPVQQEFCFSDLGSELSFLLLMLELWWHCLKMFSAYLFTFSVFSG